ncbi:MAG: LysR family transcriptional regulator, partial [Rhizobiales bacterium]|nr:LysR family transcriptional regulator [Hyphomicrobiales bacterium]
MLDRLTLDQLRILATVAETGSFSAAARKLGRVQSAISQSVQSLESTLGLPLFDRDGKVPKLNDAGRVLLQDARRLIAGADTLKARAESIASDVEPELTLAVDGIFPNAVLMACIRSLSVEFPSLPVTVFTEGLGGAMQRLQEGMARLAIAVPLPGQAADFDIYPLIGVQTVPVVAASHPLAKEASPIPRDVIERQVQLVLTDRSPLTNGIGGSVLSQQTFRFADLSTRLDFLLGGFGWCNMPIHMVREHIAGGRLVVLEIADFRPPELPLHFIYPRGRAPGRAGRWLMDDIRRRLPKCVEPMSLPAARGLDRGIRIA